MNGRFSQAIVRAPGPSFAQGLTASGLGAPDLGLAREQHAAYVEALRRAGLSVTELAEEPLFPDSTFVEDTAVLTAEWALLTRPGAPSREGEVASMRGVLEERFSDRGDIVAPGTLDGGDICEAGERFFIGVSHRTNEAGAAQLAAFLEARNRPSTIIDIREIPGLLHLKSGIAAAGEGALVVIDGLANHPAFQSCRLIRVAAEEAYAANCVHVNDSVLVAAGNPRLLEALQPLGLRLVELPMSEFQKMDGGLSCLSLRY